MARICNWRDLSPTLDAAKTWINQCLVEDGSVFSPAENLWTTENIEEFRASFVEHPDTTNDNFITKLKRQLRNCSTNTKKLASEMLWVLYLFPSPNNMGPDAKRDQIRDIWSESGVEFPKTALLNDETLTGIGSGGTAYNTKRDKELAFLIQLASDIKHQRNRFDILNDYDKFLDWIANLQQEGKRQFKQMLRYFTFPDLVERMSANNDRKTILRVMQNRTSAEVNRMTDKELDTALLEIRSRYEAQFPNLVVDFYEPPLRAIWHRDGDPPPPAPPPPPFDDCELDFYNIEDIINEGVFLETSEIEKIKHRLEAKKNLILQGAPGVGKTFVAKKFAYLLMGEKADVRIVSVQFHPSYSYEDFVRGYRPTDEAGKFELVDGSFWSFCDKARKYPDKKHVMIIDEINRGNLSQIFGELFMLLEGDKRGEEITPLYRHKNNPEEKFSIPQNVFLIGTMNIADRSLALVDYALRRRFSFVTLEPKFDSEAFYGWLENNGADDELILKITDRMAELNKRISDDRQLGPAYRIGHSFFCHNLTDSYSAAWFDEIIETEIIPLLEEYWHDNPEQLKQAKELLVQ